MSDADDLISRNRGIYGFIADEDPNRSVDEWEPFVRDLLAERDRLKDQLAASDADNVLHNQRIGELERQLAKSEQAREDAIIVERDAEIGRLEDLVEELSARPDWTAYKALQKERDYEQARAGARAEKAASLEAEVRRLKDQLAEQAKLVADTQSDLFRVSDKLAEADANGLRLAEKIEKYQAHIKSESSRLAQIDADRERLAEENERLTAENLVLKEDADRTHEVERLRARVEELEAMLQGEHAWSEWYLKHQALEGDTGEAPSN